MDTMSSSNNPNTCDHKVLKDYSREEYTRLDYKQDSQETTPKEKAILKN